MTDITDQDRRDAREWAEDVAETFKYDDEVPRETRAAVNYILATVDAPEPTLAEELMDWSHKVFLDEGGKQTMRDYSARAEKMEQDAEDQQEWNRRITEQVATLARERDEARAEVERARAEVDRLTAVRVTDPSPTLNDGSMTRPATVAREENVAPDQQGDNLPDPDDVPYGEAWLVEVDGGTVPAIKAGRRRWVYPGAGGYWDSPVVGDWFTLVTRLVPAPRQITTRGELNALPEGTVVRAKGELVCERYRHRSKGLVWISTGVDEDFPVDRPVLPATVLYAPEVAS